jgi:hypothetical protein
MKVNKSLKSIVNAAKKGEFISFQYQKENGEISKRTVRFGGDINAKLERQGTPVNGKGSWMTGSSSGLRGMIVKKNGKRYVRGTDLKDSKHKIFLVSGIILD